MRSVSTGNADCQKALALLDAYLSNELTAETAAEIGRHLERCAACREDLSIREQIKERLQVAVARNEVSPELKKRISRLVRNAGGFWISRVLE